MDFRIGFPGTQLICAFSGMNQDKCSAVKIQECISVGYFYITVIKVKPIAENDKLLPYPLGKKVSGSMYISQLFKV